MSRPRRDWGKGLKGEGLVAEPARARVGAEIGIVATSAQVEPAAFSDSTSGSTARP